MRSFFKKGSYPEEAQGTTLRERFPSFFLRWLKEPTAGKRVLLDYLK